MPIKSDIKYTKPHLEEMLSILKMDKTFNNAKGNYLYSLDNQITRKYLDLAGGFGSLLLGHNHPELVEIARELLNKGVCFHNQLSSKPSLEALGNKINDLFRSKTKTNYNTIVLNTGSEAVEAALKHALLTFDKKRKEIETEIDKSFKSIGESYLHQNSIELLDGEIKEFGSLEELRKHIDSINFNVTKNFKPRILATDKSFHGKTLGSLSITANPKYRNPFIKNPLFDTIYLDSYESCPENIFIDSAIEISIPKKLNNGCLSLKKKKFNLIAAAIVEPVIGEGGIHVVSNQFLNDLRTYTLQHKIPLIFDEIQSGCYRTGLFLASFHQNVYADYYILGKSLGGGICKISSVSIARHLYIPEFDLLHTSTFAEDDFSSLIALKSLRIMSENNHVIENISNYLFSALSHLKQKYPKVIKDIRGLGLMIGISFGNFNFSSGFGFQGIYHSQYFGYVLAAYLLNEKGIRISVTLSDSKTIRLLPSMFINEREIDQVIDALEDLCKILDYGDFYSLVSFLLPERYHNLRPVSNFQSKKVPLDDIKGCVEQVGFLLHYIDINTVRSYLPSLAILPDDMVLHLIKLLGPFSEPVIIGRNRIKNGNGNEIGITFVGLSYTAKMISDDMRKSLRNLSNYQILCNKAIELLNSFGIKKIGLGQYNSIIMQNGKAVTNPNVHVTTGNGFTTFTVVEKIKEDIKVRKGNSVKLGIVGAGGNIAKILSSMLVKQVDEILLLGRSNGNSNKLEEHAGYLIKEILRDNDEGISLDNIIYQQITTLANKKLLPNSSSKNEFINHWHAYNANFKSNKRIEIGTKLQLLEDCDIVIVATSDPTPFLSKRFFKKGALIYDISVPLNCDEDLLSDNNFKVIRGGIVKLPNNETLYPPGLYLDKGEAFACMVETMLMGFEYGEGHFSYGEIVQDQVENLGKRLLNQGFKIKTLTKVLTH